MTHLRKALAMATLCFSPPLNLSPRSPTIVEYPAQEKNHGCRPQQDSMCCGGCALEHQQSASTCHGQHAGLTPSAEQ